MTCLVNVACQSQSLAVAGRELRMTTTIVNGHSCRMQRSSSDGSQEGIDPQHATQSSMSEQPGRVLRAAGHAAGTAAQKVVTFAGKAGRLLSPSPALARHAGFGTS